MTGDMNEEGRAVQANEGETAEELIGTDGTEAVVVEESDADAVELSAAVAPATAAGPGRGVLAWCRSNLVAAVAVAALLVSAVAAASVYWWVYRPDRMTDAAAQQEVLAAAKEGTESLLSYSPEQLDADLATAKSHLTGDFLNYYSDFTDKVVAPASRDKGVKTEANVARAAVSQMRPGQADVLVFVNQVTTSKERPNPALSTSSVLVTLVNKDGHWLISAFNPV